MQLVLFRRLETDSKIITLAKIYTTTKKNPQFYFDLAEMLEILPTHGVNILTKFDEDSCIRIRASVIFLISL